MLKIAQKTIALVTIARVIRDAFSQQLKSIFNERINIKKIILEEDDNIDLSDCELVICSSKAIYNRVKKKGYFKTYFIK